MTEKKMKLTTSPTKRQQIIDAISANIRAGELAAGSRLATMRDISAGFNASLSVVQSAMKELVNSGLVECRGAGGFYVRPPEPPMTIPGDSEPPAVLTDLYVYDAVNRRVRATDPLGQTSYMEYDSRDNVVATYDARAALIADPLGLYTADNINARGNITRYAYDGMSRLWREEKEITTTGERSAYAPAIEFTRLKAPAP